GDTPVEVGRRAGRGLRVPPTADPVADLTEALDRQGFAPTVVPRRQGADVVLGVCPFASAALEHRDTVCALHLGIAEGLTDGSDLCVADLVVRDPRRAGCTIRLRPRPT